MATNERPATHSICPACGAPSRGHTADRRDVRTAYLICSAGHISSTTWLVADDAQEVA